MAIRFLNKTNTSNISIIQNNLNIGSNDDPDVLLHLRSNSRAEEIPTIRIQDSAGGAAGNSLDIEQITLATKLTGVDSFEFKFSTVYTDTVLNIQKRQKNSGAYEGTVGILREFPKAALDVDGGVRIADDQDVATSDKAGTMRYREETNNLGIVIASHIEMCMLIDITNSVKTYDWVSIKENTWL